MIFMPIGSCNLIQFVLLLYFVLPGAGSLSALAHVARQSTVITKTCIATSTTRERQLRVVFS